MDGKQFAVGGERFRFRGVTYGTFQPRVDGARFPIRPRIERDFSAMRQAGFSVVRTYTQPSDDVVELASQAGLRLMSDVFYPDWRYLVGNSRRDARRVARQARAEVRAAARRFAGNETFLALSLGNEIPADVLRWVGTKAISDVISELVEVVREEDPGMLVTYANYPTAEYLTLPDVDFLTFNVFLERQADFRKYLTRLHHLAGDRPLVLGEMGLDCGNTREGEQGQAETIDWLMETAIERGVAGTCLFSWTDEWWVGDAAVEGWYFGLTRADRSPRQALDVARTWNQRTVRDLDVRWPSISVVVCAYNAAATMDECLRHACALDYPDLEIIVVDDGSTDDTAAIAERHPRARLVKIPHAGLSVARNEGFRAARGDLVAYLDSDAYPPPEWPYYLALGLDAPDVGGVGGPNVPPQHDPVGAHMVARSPGGPVHVLLTDDRAEHIPGCNMAFWKEVLEEVGGFDPVYTSAGDDVDLCWKVLDRGWQIGFHPAALVWHHRRAGLRPYLRQQRGYGRAEALVEARHPDRFTPLGTARWRGRIYNSLLPSRLGQRVYRGLYGAAAYQSVYQAGGHALDIAHQAGVPLAVVLLLTAPLALLWPELGLVALAALLTLLVLAAIDVFKARPPQRVSQHPWRFRLGVATMHLLQPLVRTWGRSRHGPLARRDLPPIERLPTPLHTLGGVLLGPASRPRAEVAATLVGMLRRRGLRVALSTGWEDHDARWAGSSLLFGELITSSHPPGCIQMRVRRRVRWLPALAVMGLFAASTPWNVTAGIPVALLGLFELGRGLWRTRRLARLLGLVSPREDERREATDAQRTQPPVAATRPWSRPISSTTAVLHGRRRSDDASSPSAGGHGAFAPDRLETATEELHVVIDLTED